MKVPVDGLTPLAAAQPAKARAGYHLPFLAIVLGLLLLAALFLTRVSIFGFELFIRDAGKTTDTTPISVTLGEVEVSIPQNLIRSRSGRGSDLQQLELHLHWPSLEGFSVERAGQFQSPAAQAPIVYVTLEPAGGRMSPEERFRNVYPRLLMDGVETSEEGYAVRRFRTGHGYDGERLYIARDPYRPLVARCEAADGPVGPTCIASFRSGTGLEVAYRMRWSLLSEWRAVDQSVRRLVREMAVAPGA